MNLKQKLVEIRKSIGILRKTEKGDHCQYVDPALLLAKATEKMNELQVLLTPNVKSAVLTREKNPTKNKPDAVDFCASLTIDMVFHDAETDETLSTPWFAFGSNSSDPAMAGGSALTYSERYFLLKFFNVPTTKDDPDFLKEQVAGPKPIDEKIIESIEKMMTAARVDHADYLKYLGITAVSEIPTARVGVIMAELKRIADKNKAV